MPCSAHSAHHIELEEVKPFAIALLEEIIRMSRAEVIHEDVGVRRLRDKRGRSFRGRKISRDAGQFGIGHDGPDLL